MKAPKCSTSRWIGLAGVVVAVAGCDDGPIAPERSVAASSAVKADAPGDRYIVLLKEGGQPALRASAVGSDVASLGGRIERSHAEIGVLQVRGLSQASAARLAGRADVEAVAKDRKIRWLPPSEQRAYGAQGLSDRSNQRGAAFFDQFQWNLRRIQAPRAWNQSRQGQGVLVCILDTGVDPRHIDLAGKLDLDVSASFVGTERADRDLFFHGTAMASIIASNGIGMGSVAPDARLCSVKVLDRTGSGTFGDVQAGILYVGTAGVLDGGAKVEVANMSFGVLLPRNDPELETLIRATQRAINFSTRRGVLFVAAAGNEAVNLNDPNLISVPAGLNNVISVGATGPINQRQRDRIASYSNVGRQGVDVFAPGGEFAFARNVLEDLILMACSASNRLDGFEDCRNGNVYVFVAGTSAAAAHVSGEAAVIESELAGDQSPDKLTDCIFRSADPLPDPLLTANGRINVFRGQNCAPYAGSGDVASR